ncbi:hypothetical protein A3C89_02905 [Candidatus Kaiserbacteria bacterium RIFCSPHIGHO2_02_FULL_50_50]|uniref:Uncharacterized protein n=1 Tax=Candidatus Kaiserbacteria bacterium RIFCSPHIGHO2_02_FULL_50_50 TaxID=1798492 RepID=A0A1F6DDB8_9BACT|nr:MAG: hypothetical protein A3C89_02905 [Candidatus Kaiserbacteria bacterium RIFCSPHIGHO2_02_FULL_50_50]OGG89121.1 MAG: hypothetical protein A3G62_00025 [Candidatus Kaiserbacteria bacterium RIFCSPLOWO2_12_FULL_50_10]
MIKFFIAVLVALAVASPASAQSAGKWSAVAFYDIPTDIKYNYVARNVNVRTAPMIWLDVSSFKKMAPSNRVFLSGQDMCRYGGPQGTSFYLNYYYFLDGVAYGTSIDLADEVRTIYVKRPNAICVIEDNKILIKVFKQ